MKICEFFKNQFEDKKANAKWFNSDSEAIVNAFDVEKGSYQWFKELAKRYFGGGYEQEFAKAGITHEQLKQAKEAGYMKYKYYSNWEARQLSQTDWWALTEKGLKVLYKCYVGQW